jgi:hypothetical protein
MTARLERDFPRVEELFRMIDDEGQVPLVVPHGDAADRIGDYRADPGRRTLRALQPYLINLPQLDAARLEAAGRIETIHDQVRWLPPGGGRQYDPRFGLRVDEIVPRDPNALIVDDLMG